jgi:multisubunit Na+/H+ antiporter MnhG subunit
MTKIISIVLVIAGWLLVIFSLVALARLFDTFTKPNSGTGNAGYIFGSVLAPMLLIAIARWMIRMGMKNLRHQKKS